MIDYWGTLRQLLHDPVGDGGEPISFEAHREKLLDFFESFRDTLPLEEAIEMGRYARQFLSSQNWNVPLTRRRWLENIGSLYMGNDLCDKQDALHCDHYYEILRETVTIARFLFTGASRDLFPKEPLNLDLALTWIRPTFWNTPYPDALFPHIRSTEKLILDRGRESWERFPFEEIERWAPKLILNIAPPDQFPKQCGGPSWVIEQGASSPYTRVDDTTYRVYAPYSKDGIPVKWLKLSEPLLVDVTYEDLMQAWEGMTDDE